MKLSTNENHNKTDLKERANIWQIVFNKPIDNPNSLEYGTLFKQLKSAFLFVAMIAHERDIDDKGKLKTYHIHAVIKTTRIRKQTLLNDLRELTSLPENCIGIEKVVNERSMLRYLIHLDEDSDKKPHYPPFLVDTTDEEYYNDMLIERELNLTPEKLIRIVRDEKTSARILLKIGADNYKKYKGIINDLQREHG